jgi:large subunit ribosomal protein L10
MARPEKVAVVEEIREKLGAADAAVLTEYRGLTVTALAELRGALRPANTESQVF